MPILIADYVLYEYGTGAVMGVPAHDVRDFKFATEKGLPIKTVIIPDSDVGANGNSPSEAYTEPGTIVNSGQFDDTPSVEGKAKIIAYAEEKGYGKARIQYRPARLVDFPSEILGLSDSRNSL